MSQNKKDHTPKVYVIAGPNGAGKTTFAKEYLPGYASCLEFLNADLIAAGLNPFAPENENVRAGRLLLSRIRELRQEGKDFGFETTLAGRNHAQQISQLKALGYRVILFFLWLPDANFAVQRVLARVLQGGHNIPEVDIRRRFESGLGNLFKLYRPLVHELVIYDGSQLVPRLISCEIEGNIEIIEPDLFRLISLAHGRKKQ